MLRYTVSGMIRGKLAELASAAESTESCLSAAVWIGAQTFIWTHWNGSTRARRTRKFEAELWLIYPNKASLRRSATDFSPVKADGSWQLHPKSATFMVRHHCVMLFLIGKKTSFSPLWRKKKQRGGGELVLGLKADDLMWGSLLLQSNPRATGESVLYGVLCLCFLSSPRAFVSNQWTWWWMITEPCPIHGALAWGMCNCHSVRWLSALYILFVNDGENPRTMCGL